MKRTIISLFALGFLVTACNNNSTDTTTTTDSSNIMAGKDSMGGSKMNDSATTTPTTSTITTDAASSAFLAKAANGGMSEVQQGQLAQNQGTNQAVKDFGSMMVNDHSAANDKIKGLAAPRSVTLPAAVAAKEQKMADELGKKTGKAFDKAYIDGMVKDHMEDIKEFEDASKKVKDNDVKAFIESTLPTLRMHLDSAKAIQKRLK